MIVRVDGRAKSVRTPSEAQQELEALLRDLSPDERRAVEIMMREVSFTGESAMLSAIGESHFIQPQVPMRQFLEDDYYLGLSCRTLYPKIREDLVVFDEQGPFSEVLLGGGIGYGKSTLASILMAWTLYRMSLLYDPQSAVGLSPGSEIHMVVLSKNLHLARRVMLSAVMEKIRLSPYFQDCFPFKESSDEVKFPRGIVLQIGSINSERVLGLNVFASAMDEANFYSGNRKSKFHLAAGERATEASFDAAEKMYAKLDRRIKSRFARGGGVPTVNILLSSKTTGNAFMERRIRASASSPAVFVREYANWQVKESNFGPGRFRVLVGRGSIRSKILEPDEEVLPGMLAESESLVIKVPNEFREDFERDLMDAIRDIAGLSTDAISAFMARHDAIYRAVNPKLVHPFTEQEWTFGSVGGFRWHDLATQHVRKLLGGFEEIYWRPRRSPDEPRHVHIDVAVSGDSLGIAMGYNTGMTEVVRRAPDGSTYTELEPKHAIDFMLRVYPPHGEQIHLADIRRIVYEMIEHGFNVVSLSCDQYQSTDTLQQMRARGIKAYLLSLDRTTEGYEALRNAFYDDRLEMYHYQPLFEELLALEYDRTRGKIDHPPYQSKDVADAVAGVVTGLRRMSSSLPMGFTVSGSATHADDGDEDWLIGQEVVSSGGGATAPTMPFTIG